MLDAAKANALTQAITDSFAAIGAAVNAAPGTAMPKSKGNLEPIAYDLFCAKLKRRLADAAEKKAVAAAVKAGVIFDPEKAPLVVGSNALVYAGDVVEISCGVTTPATRVDVSGYVDALEKAGVKRPLLDRVLALHTHENRAPHKFTATLITSR